MNVVFEARILPGGGQVLIPKANLPRMCRRLDGVATKAYATRSEARRARTKHDSVYHCSNCGYFHLATDTRARRRSIAERRYASPGNHWPKVARPFGARRTIPM